MSTPNVNLPSDIRVNRPERCQREWRPFSLEEYISSDHRVRIVWCYVESLDVSPLYKKIKAVKSGAGRNAVDPRILIALWLYATIDAVSSAREIARLTESELAYMWICGNVSVNYHMLSDFRTENCDFLEKVLTTTVAALMHSGAVTLETVAQDGVRVRANAGSSSFRRQATLEKCLEQAEAHVKKLAEQESSDASKAQQSARERAAKEQLERAKDSLRQVTQLTEEREKRKKGTGAESRCSTTDPDARKMKMGDGGYRPAYNVQLATDGGARIVVGVSVTNVGNDFEQMAPMHEKIINDYGRTPENYLVDCGYPAVSQVTELEKGGTRVYAPVHGEESMRKRGKDPFARQKRDTDESYQFRQRMATDEAKELYKKRPSIAEFPHAEFRNRGLTQFRVRGHRKVLAVALWHAITFNLMRMINLGVFM